MGLIALGIGVGFGIAAVRNVPAVMQPALPLVFVIFVVGMLIAYFGGRRFAQQQFQIQMQHQLQDQKQAQHQAVQVFVAPGGSAAAQAVVGPPVEEAHQLARSATHHLPEGIGRLVEVNETESLTGLDALDPVVIEKALSAYKLPRRVVRPPDSQKAVGADHG